MEIEEQYDKIYRFCLYRVQDRETAEDLTQETFLRFMASRYEERGQGIRYLYAIARNLCIEESRRIRAGELPEDLSDGGAGSEELIEQIRVRQVLGTFPEKDRELLILRYLNGETIMDLCQITGLSRFAPYRKLKRLKKEFLRQLEGGGSHA